MLVGDGGGGGDIEAQHVTRGRRLRGAEVKIDRPGGDGAGAVGGDDGKFARSQEERNHLRCAGS